MDGTSAVVTGASRGIGASVAARFAADGADVTCCARTRDAVESVVEGIVDDGGEARAVRADVRDEFDVERLMETAAREAGDIDVVVANAAVNHGEAGSSPLHEESYTRFDDTMRTNLRGVFTTVREALPTSPPTGGFSSRRVPSRGSRRRAWAHAVSKAGAEALVRGFAADLDQAVGIVDPGYVATDLSGGKGRDPDDVAPMFVWAARDADAGTVDGEVLDLRTWKSATR
ncbi:SDR family NAD(P)-dependent oxidoreductase [Haloplanus litoreus]|uniref:SDR family NAD(P)-dependent oxidoreductase n=1 Tax=Haloplanus litoreus TaxID=767515 RepID=UPI003616014D